MIIIYAFSNLFLSVLTIRFDAIVSADAFENLKPAPDIFLAASKTLNVHPSEVYYVIDILIVASIFFSSLSCTKRSCRFH